ncbi:MAG: WbqC family protein [bacterium]
MIVGIHQPQFFPWIGYFDKIKKSDIFVLLDDVQFKKNEWQNRNRIKTACCPQWLTVPVSYHFPEKIAEVKINNRVDWRRKHLNAFTTNYGKAAYFTSITKLLTELYEKDWEYLVDLNMASIETIIEFLGVKTKIVRSSTIETIGSSTERLVSICQHFRTDCYLSGQGGKDYLDESLFDKANIRIIYQKFEHPVYQQCFEGFNSHLSIIDLLFNCGPESKAILEIE